MRSFLAMALLVASLAAALPAQAQTPDAPLATDPVGDVVLSIQGQPAGSGSQLYPGADLVALRLVESTTGFTWTVEVADLRPASEETGVDGVQASIAFDHHGRFFSLELSLSLQALSNGGFAALYMADAPAGPYTQTWFSFFQPDLTADTMAIEVPREALADLDGATPYPGRMLGNISVTASSTLSNASIGLALTTVPFPLDARDRMPEPGTPLPSYAVQVGVLQTGHARLASPQPFRASNGEATTFVYEVEASNIGETNASFELVAVGAPARVDVVVPVPLLVIAAGETVQVPVLATIPFGHQHGGVDRFTLELTDLDDPTSVGRLEMGIRYLEVPQPAGHHNTLWLHMPPEDNNQGGVALLFREAFMNTQDQDEAAGPGPYYSAGLSGGGTSWTNFWNFQLAPGLEMGLDMDRAGVGQLSLEVGTTLPLLAATLSGTLYVGTTDFFDEDVTLATFQSEPVDIDPNGRHTYVVAVQPADNVLPVPFEPGRNLFLDVSIEYQGAPSPLIGLAQDTPYIAPGGFLQLPLREWHDDVDDALNAVGGPVLRSLGDQERLVNPGEALVFQAAMTNPTDQDIPVGFEVTGSNLAWATLPTTRLVLPAGGNVTVSLIVRPDAAALDGDRADLILQVFPEEMPQLRALLRLVAEVDTDSDFPDEAPLATQLTKKESPVSPLLVLVALAGALALALRRR